MSKLSFSSPHPSGGHNSQSRIVEPISCRMERQHKNLSTSVSDTGTAVPAKSVNSISSVPPKPTDMIVALSGNGRSSCASSAILTNLEDDNSSNPAMTPVKKPLVNTSAKTTRIIDADSFQRWKSAIASAIEYRMYNLSVAALGKPMADYLSNR